MAGKNKIISVASYNDKEFEQFTENITRVRYIKYFKGTKPVFKERESTGIFIGAVLCFIIGCIMAPYLLKRGSDLSPLTITVFTIVMAITGIILTIWGLKKVLHERRRTYKPVKDEEFDKYFAFDIEGLKVRARFLVTDKTMRLKDEEDSIENVSPIVLYAPEEYSSNVNLPMLCKCGEDGIIRASNLYVMIIFPTSWGVYINTTYLNLCNGSAKFDRIYACPYEDIESITYKKREYNVVSQGGKEFVKRAKSFLIQSNVGDTSEVGLDIVDYDMVEQLGGRFDESAAKNAVTVLTARAGLQLPSEE